jgi:hypothetical protein
MSDIREHTLDACILDLCSPEDRMDISIRWKQLGVISFLCAGAALAAAQTTSGSNITFSVNGRVGFVLNKGIAAADFTHSGQLSYGFLSSAVGLWVENPAGLYRLQLPQNADPDEMQVADFNNDGNLDIAVELRAANRLNILLGHGDGTFQFAPDVILSGHPRAIVPANFDKDGFADLAVIVCTDQSICSLQRFHGNGDGTFALAQTIALPGNKHVFAAGMMTSVDFNRDGNNDVALIANNSIVMVFTSSANGTLQLHTKFALPAGTTASALAWGSIKKAAPPVPDLVVRVIGPCISPCISNTLNTAYVYVNDGTGLFHLSAHLPLTNSAYGGLIGVGDIDGDQKADIVGFTSDPNNQVMDYALGRGDGTFNGTVHALGQADLTPGSNTLPPTYFDRPRAMVMRDVNSDSRLDIALQDSGALQIVNQNGATNCIPPSTATLGARICTPAGTTATAGQPFVVSASGASPAGVKRLELWVNGKKTYQTWSEQLKFPLTLSAGTYRISVIAVDVGDTHVASQPVLLTVQ